MNTPTHVFYEPGSLSIVDTVDADGKSHFARETLEEIRKRYPTANLVTFDEACAQIDKAAHEKFRVNQPHRITEAEYYDALECLPPMKWRTDEAGTSFMLAELTCGNITAAYAHIAGEYWTVNVRTSATHEQIMNMIP